MKPVLSYPIHPVSINQGFGENPAYYARFKDVNGNPEKGHMGVDFQAKHGQEVYAAHDGMASFARDEHGGEGVYVRGNGFRTIYWHLCGDTDPNFVSPIPTTGEEVPVKNGQLIGYADNTGAPFESSGDHLHFGLLLVNEFGNPLNTGNGYGGCIDPEPYFTQSTDGGVQVLLLQAQRATIKLLQDYITYLKSKIKSS